MMSAAKRVYLLSRSVVRRNESVCWFFRNMLDPRGGSAADETLDGLSCKLCAVSESGELVLLTQMNSDELREFSNGTVELTLSTTNSSGASTTAPPLSSSSASIETPTTRRSVPSMQIHPASELVVLASAYRIVFSVDVSPSCASIDAETNEVLFDTLTRTLERAWFALLDEFRLVGSRGDFTIDYAPQLEVSVIAQMGLADTFWSVLQCARLTRASIGGLLDIVRRRLQAVESLAADRAAQPSFASEYGAAGVDLLQTIQNAAFVLKRMPDEARSLIVLVTDGAVSMPSSTGNFDRFANRCLLFDLMPAVFCSCSPICKRDICSVCVRANQSTVC